jgi:hypothetical protein
LFCKSYFCPSCAAKKNYKYNLRIKQNLGDRSWRFLTLTTINDGRNKSSQIKKISKDWNKLRTLLRKHYGSFSYAKVLEVGDKGMVHLHILIDVYIPIERIRKLWVKYCGAYKIDISKVKSHERIVRYILKYLSKSARSESTNELFYITSCRRITFSRNMRLDPYDGDTYRLAHPIVLKDQQMINTLISMFVDKDLNLFDFDFSHLPPPLSEYFKFDFLEILKALDNGSREISTKKIKGVRNYYA